MGVPVDRSISDLMTDGDLTTKYSTPNNAGAGGEVAVSFPYAIDVGTLILVPGTATKIPIEIATGFSLTHADNDADSVICDPQSTFMVCAVFAY